MKSLLTILLSTTISVHAVDDIAAPQAGQSNPQKKRSLNDMSQSDESFLIQDSSVEHSQAKKQKTELKWRYDTAADIIQKANQNNQEAQEFIIHQTFLGNIKIIGEKSVELININNWENIQEKVLKSKKWLESFVEIYKEQYNKLPLWMLTWLQSVVKLNSANLHQHFLDHQLETIIYYEFAQDHNFNKKLKSFFTENLITQLTEPRAIYKVCKYLLSSKRDNNNLNECAHLKDLLIKNSKNSLLENYLLGKEVLINILAFNEENLIALKNKIVGQGGIWAYKRIRRDFKEELGDLSLQFLKEGYENGDIKSGYIYAESLIENSNDVEEIDKGINILNDVYIYDYFETDGIISNINKDIPRLILEIKLKGRFYKEPYPPNHAVKRLNEYLNILNSDLNTIVSTLNSFKAEKQEFLTFVQDAQNQWTNIFQQFLTNFPKQPTFMIARNFPQEYINDIILELLKFPEMS